MDSAIPTDTNIMINDDAAAGKWEQDAGDQYHHPGVYEQMKCDNRSDPDRTNGGERIRLIEIRIRLSQQKTNSDKTTARPTIKFFAGTANIKSVDASGKIANELDLRRSFSKPLSDPMAIRACVT
jgi:hypothetical protein